jgi:hypothetical protein
MVANRLQGAAPKHGECGQAAGVRQHLAADLAALDAVAVEQRALLRQTAADQGQLPGEIAGILDARVHALAACGAVNMGGVAGEEHAAGAIVGHLALVDAERGQPDRRGRLEAAGPAPVEHRLHLLERRVCPASALRRVPGIGDNPVSPRRYREQRQRTVGVPEHRQLIRLRPDTREMHVGQNPVARQRVALELHPETVPHGAVGAIATDQPSGLQRLLAPVRVTQGGRDLVRSGDEPRQFDLALHLQPAGTQMLPQQALGLALGEHERVGVRRGERGEGNMGDLAIAGKDVGRRYLEAR